MTDVIDKVFEVIIETLVVTPLVFVILSLLLLACIFYPIKKISRWLVKQVRRIVDIWVYYVENAYMYEEKDDEL